jgi:putative NADH-flavin reductase
LADGGHCVRALARDPAAAGTFGDTVSVVSGDARDGSAVAQTVDGQDAVISAFGQRSRRKDDLQEAFYRNLIAAMEARLHQRAASAAD